MGSHCAPSHVGTSQVGVQSLSSWLWASIALCEIAILVRQRGRSVRCTLDCRERLHQEQGLGAFLGQFLDPLLQLRDLLRVLVGKVGLLRRVLRDVVQLQRRRQRGAPDELPVTLAYAAAERLDVVDYFLARRGLALADAGPNGQAIQGVALVGVCSGERSPRW